MARIRTIKPEFWSHPILSKQPDSVRLCAIALLNLADDEGYFFASPQLVRGFVWPLDEDSTSARRALATLCEIGWIKVVEHKTHGPVGRVVNFTTHQRVDRANPSKIKTYFIDEDSTSARRTIDERSTQEQGREGNREQGREQVVIVEKDTKKNGLTIKVDEFLERWNRLAENKGLPKVMRMSSARRGKLTTRLKSAGWFETFLASTKKLPLPGDGWQPDFDWFVANDENAAKIIEGKYDWRGKGNGKPPAEQFTNADELEYGDDLG